jgi:hypothetical protein
MGILKHLLFWPVTGPKFLFDFSMDKVQGVVRDELTDDTPVKADLMELQLLLELGDIDDAEYIRREQVLMQRLREIREWREEFGMGVSGGPVRVAASADAEKDAGAEPPPEREPHEMIAPPDAEESEKSDSQGPKVAKPDEATIDLHLDWE